MVHLATSTARARRRLIAVSTVMACATVGLIQPVAAQAEDGIEAPDNFGNSAPGFWGCF